MARKIQNEDVKSSSDLTGAGGTDSQLINTTKMYTPKSASILETTLRKNNYASSADPTATDDIGDGYEVGSVWVNTTADTVWVCVDSTASAAIWNLASAVPDRTFYLRHTTTGAVDGGSATANTVHTRVLNTSDGDTTYLASLSGNQFTVTQTGTYRIEGEVTGFRVNQHQAYIYNVTDAVYVLDAAVSVSSSATSDTTTSNFLGTATLNSAKSYSVRHWTNTAKATDGLGTHAAIGVNPATRNIYVQIAITKVS